ncbi:cyclic nucleotide-gated potassium channel [bacterium BMS3Bbin10]|nr:cyclic nucleotide-gated potassium channel [bacterium BMS3Bbin10]
MPNGLSNEMSPSPPGPVSLRQRIHDILEYGSEHDPVTRLVNTILVTLILLNVAAFAAETMPDVGPRYRNLFELFNLVSVAIFSVEYVLRLWSCTEMPLLRAQRPWRARLKFAMRPLLIIDLIAILPFYLGFLIGVDLRVLRVLRLFRFLKLARYSPALVALGRVIANERRALFGALLVMLALLLFASSGMYFIERNVQPEVFGSIPSAAWWALATLTTVGYGDVTPVTSLGKAFGGLIMIFGLGMFALPIGIIATGFSQEANRREFVITWGMVARVPLFAQLEATVVARIGAMLYSRSYVAGEPIMRIGDDADAMFFISSGEVAVETGEGQVRLGEGDFFGEMALLYRRRREHNVTAVTNCRLLVLDKLDFERLCHSEPELVSHVRRVAEARLKAGKTKR